MVTRSFILSKHFKETGLVAVSDAGDASLLSWIVDYLTDRPQYVCIQGDDVDIVESTNTRTGLKTRKGKDQSHL